jgi:hypothetical protein
MPEQSVFSFPLNIERNFSSALIGLQLDGAVRNAKPAEGRG